MSNLAFIFGKYRIKIEKFLNKPDSFIPTLMEQFKSSLTSDLITDFKHLLEVLIHCDSWDIAFKLVHYLQDRDKLTALNTAEYSGKLDSIIHNFVNRFKSCASNYKFNDWNSSDLEVLNQLFTLSHTAVGQSNAFLYLQNLVLEFKYHEAMVQAASIQSPTLEVSLLYAFLLYANGRTHDSLLKFKSLLKPIHINRFRDIRLGISMNLLAIGNYSKAMIGFMKNYEEDNEDEDSLRGIIKCAIILRDLNIPLKYTIDINALIKKYYRLIHYNDNLSYKMYFLINLFHQGQYKLSASLAEELIKSVFNHIKSDKKFDPFQDKSDLDLSKYKTVGLVCNYYYLCYFLMKSLVHLKKYKEAVKFHENHADIVFSSDIQLLVLKCFCKKFISEVYISDKDLKVLSYWREQMRNSSKFKHMRSCIDILMIHYYQSKGDSTLAKTHIESLLNPEVIKNEEGIQYFKNIDPNVFYIFLNYNFDNQPLLCKIILEKLLLCYFDGYSMDLTSLEENQYEKEIQRYVNFIRLKLNLAALYIKFDDHVILEPLLEECKVHVQKLLEVSNKLKDYTMYDFSKTTLEMNLRLMNIVLKQNYSVYNELKSNYEDAIRNHKDILTICPKIHESAFRLEYLNYFRKPDWEQNFMKLIDKYCNESMKKLDIDKYYRMRQRILQYWAYAYYLEGRWDHCKDLIKSNLFIEVQGEDGNSIRIKEYYKDCHYLHSLMLVCYVRLCLKARTEGTDDNYYLMRIKEYSRIILEYSEDSLKNYTLVLCCAYVSFSKSKFTESLNFTSVIYEKMKQFKNMAYNSQFKMTYFNCVFNLALFEFYNASYTKAQNYLKELLSSKLQLNRLGMSDVLVVSLYSYCALMDQWNIDSLTQLITMYKEYSIKKIGYKEFFVGLNLAYCYWKLAQHCVEDQSKRTSRVTQTCIDWLNEALSILQKHNNKEIAKYQLECINMNKYKEKNQNVSMINKVFYRTKTGMLDLFADLNSTKDLCSRVLTEDKQNESNLHLLYKENASEFNKKEQEKLSKLKEQEQVQLQKKEDEKVEAKKIQENYNDLFSEVNSKMASNATTQQSRVIKRKRNDNEQEFIDNNDGEETLEVHLDDDEDEDSDYEKKHTYKAKQADKKKKRALRKEKVYEEDNDDEQDIDELF